MQVEVIYALPAQQILFTVELPEGSTVRDAVQRSGVLNAYPELELSSLKLGIFSQFVTLDTQLAAGDRIEIYRPLLIDPKQARLLRAKKKR